MKHLFFVAVAIGIFSGTTISVKAQTNVNIERFENRATPKNSPKFIEGIEIIAEATTPATVPVEEKPASGIPIVAKPTVSHPVFPGNIELCAPLHFKYAMLTDREVESITNFPLYSFIDDWWATRYQYGGTGRSGIDCSAFTGKLLAQVYGLTVPRTAKEQFKICEKLATEDMLEGDLVFFNTTGGISHVGLYLGNNYFVHSSVHGGVKISSLTDEYYGRKLISGGRIPLPPKEVLSNEYNVLR